MSKCNCALLLQSVLIGLPVFIFLNFKRTRQMAPPRLAIDVDKIIATPVL